MGLGHSPSPVLDGLVMYLDAKNTKSYPGTGTSWRDLSGTSAGRQFTLTVSSYYTYDGITAGSFTFTRTTPPAAEDSGYATHTASGNIAMSTYLYNDHTTEVWAKINNINPTNHDATETLSALFLYVGYHAGFAYSGTTFHYEMWSGASTNVIPVTLSVGTSSGDIIQGNWFQVAVSRSGNLFSIYLNGAFKSSNTVATTSAGVLTSNVLRVSLGNSHGFGYSYPASNTVSAVRMYNRALSAAEIARNFNSLRGRFGL